MTDPADHYETIVIGAGPAGLTAALYLARYRREVLVIHDGKSRALRIPKTHNVPGFPDGIEGPDLIEHMTRHAEEFGTRIKEAKVTGIEPTDTGFRLTGSIGETWESRAAILASGILLNQVDLPHEVHEAAIEAGVLRYCPVCDGYEHSGARIGVIGCDSDGAAEALFLRQYSVDITLMPLSHPELSREQASEMADAGIAVETGALLALEPHDDHMEVRLDGRDAPLSFDVIYPALGCRPRGELAEQLGIELRNEGCVPAGAEKDSGVPGFFAAGDVVEGLDQISVAMGHGALAATKAHNWLREQDRHTLQADE
ncbi:NAD(P)/FAD-dependent oxidoreductase [Novosphingobium sp. CCH12-A3]|uniref:NAD(P)/FAD-dependent oxidoreductase n=1 Tax=Novosphingobium sp. CCH12-A3 TaxID=1768752 RepID=UPI000B272F34|nr:NAD(P)/FAD-dependent oxidoreductase [Novosphingobium sp. CCH12-A3]